MKKAWLIIAVLCMLFAGCAGSGSDEQLIDFDESKMYAVAHLGYKTIENFDFYKETYLNGKDVPVHYISDGDYYLIIPKNGMKLELYENSIENLSSSLIYEEEDCKPFIIKCNVSDIFPDVTIKLKGEKEVEFSPFISLMDGGLDIGEAGIDITK